ncbi:MAG: protein kinase, partial [Actinomycetia bacterium]|nr:protein kinase [Actinomycetes bacterium]
MADDNDPGIDGLTRFRRIGSGGFSTVYVAWEAVFSRWVAVKVLQDLDEAAHRRFDRERSLMGRSSGHPNVITPIRSGLTSKGRPYLVMQYMEGGSLEDIIKRGEVLPWRE